MNPDYVESVWWALKQIFDKGLLVEDYRVAPYCPRCGTGLSDHELAQGYETVVDPSVYVRFPLTSGPLAGQRRPAGLDDHAVDAGVQHRGRGAPRRRPTSSSTDGTETLVVAEPLLAKALGEGWEVDRRAFTGTRDGALDLPAAVRARRRPRTRTTSCWPTTSPPRTAPAWCTRPPPSAPTTCAVCRAYGLPVVNPIRADGTFEADVPLVGGRVLQGRRRGAGRRPARARRCCSGTSPYEHSYPHCWRCHTPLIYYALPSWYIRTTAIKDALLRENERDQLVPGRRSSTAATATG